MLRFKEKFRQILTTNSALFNEVYRLSLVQCNSYGSLNLRRFVQIVQLYKKLYNENSVYGLLRNFSRRYSIFHHNSSSFLPKNKRFGNFGAFKGATGGALLSASIFSFNVHGIADEDMIEAANSLAHEMSLVRPTAQNSILSKTDVQDWELLTERTDFQVWRRNSPENKKLFEYKCAGRFYDVPAYGFYIAQIDLDYRKQWDQLVVLLDVIDSDTETGSEVIRWITHFPFPMCPREYVYVRRSCVDPFSKKMVLTSKTVNHPMCPRDDRKYVRVDNYYSCMVIKPHKEFHDNGFDYVLTYFDDPKAPFPSLAYNWMVTTGVPGFVEKVYQAARDLANSQKININNLNFPNNEIFSRKIYCLPNTTNQNRPASPRSTEKCKLFV